MKERSCFSCRSLSAVVFLTGVLSALVAVDRVATAEQTMEVPETRVIETEKSFDALVQSVRKAVKENNMGLVAAASASRGAASRGIDIPGNAVLMVFRNDYAVRMLTASLEAGIEAPLRIYVTEDADGTARLAYRLPSEVFRPYNSPDLNDMARELDVIFAKIADDAAAD